MEGPNKYIRVHRRAYLRGRRGYSTLPYHSYFFVDNTLINLKDVNVLIIHIIVLLVFMHNLIVILYRDYNIEFFVVERLVLLLNYYYPPLIMLCRNSWPYCQLYAFTTVT